MNIAIVGTQWGDEGKGKAIDVLSGACRYIVRFQGGNNAGHTVVVGKEEFIFHLIPSGVLRPHKTCVIANGVVVDPAILIKEINELKEKGIALNRRLKVSYLCHAIFPYHKILDKLREKKRRRKIGTTGRGIGPCYSDKINRCGIRMIDLVRPQVFAAKLKDNLKEKNEIFRKVYKHPGFSFKQIYREYLEYALKLKPYLCDVAELLTRAAANKKPLLFEGAQGTFLDIDFGTYPYVTSSSTIAGGISSGSGIPHFKIDKVIGVAKAYATRVGQGSFPTELSPKFGEYIRTKGSEFGATTGRKRRCGWFDALMVAEAVRLNGISELAIMKLDVLDSLKRINVCIAYKYKGKIFKKYPTDPDIISKGSCIWKEFAGWDGEIQAIRNYKDLPRNAKNYIKGLQDLSNARIFMVSVGSERDQTIFID